MSINKEWHEKHKMPKNPSFEERVKWHLAHRKRAIPDKLLQAMKNKNINMK